MIRVSKLLGLNQKTSWIRHCHVLMSPSMYNKTRLTLLGVDPRNRVGSNGGQTVGHRLNIGEELLCYRSLNIVFTGVFQSAPFQ